MTRTTRSAEQQVFVIYPESLSVTDECLAAEGAKDGIIHSIHLRFTPSEDSCVELFHFGPGLFSVNGVIDSSQKDALLKEVSERQTLTLLVTDSDATLPSRSGYPAELAEQDLGVETSA